MRTETQGSSPRNYKQNRVMSHGQEEGKGRGSYRGGQYGGYRVKVNTQSQTQHGGGNTEMKRGWTDEQSEGGWLLNCRHEGS